MRYILLILFIVSFSHADLQSKINSNAQTACYLKNPTNGLSASDYSPTVIGQTLRQTIESTHTQTQSRATCDDWTLDPYVNVDTETYQVIADMSCTVNQETIDDCGADNPCPVTYYWTTIKEYSLSIDCQASCEVPRDSNGKIYDFTSYISETDCTVSNLQQLVLAEDPNSQYVIDDAQYLNCTSNSGLTGCFYHKHVNFDGNTDNNSTDNNTTSDSNSTDNNTTDNNATDLTDTNNKLDSIGTKIDANGQKIDNLGTKMDDLGTKIDANGQKIDNLGSKIDANGARIEDVANSVINSGNYIGNKVDSLGTTLSDELKSQGDRLHNDLQDLKSSLNDNNSSNGFDDSRIVDAIHKNTDAIKEIKDMHEGEVDADTSFFDTYQGYYNDMSQSIDNVENNVNDLMATIQGDYTPNFQNYNACIIHFPIMNKSVSADMCKYSPILKPYLTFILTVSMLILLIRLHFYLFPKVMRSD